MNNSPPLAFAEVRAAWIACCCVGKTLTGRDAPGGAAPGVAAILREGEEPDRKAAARFFHAVALKWLSEGDRYAAGEAIKEAVKTWPDHRMAVLDDPVLANELL